MAEKDEPVIKGQNKLTDEGTKVSEDKNTAQSSPARRVRRLKQSRDSWKSKTKENQKKIKALQIKTRDLSESRKTWKERAKQAETELKEAKDLLAQQGVGESPKKNQRNP